MRLPHFLPKERKETMTTDQEVYRPLPEIVAAANVNRYEEMAHFWAQRAQEFGWFKPRDKVLDDPNNPY